MIAAVMICKKCGAVYVDDPIFGDKCPKCGSKGGV